MRYESPLEIEHPEEAAELLECLGHRKVFNLADFRWGRADALIIDDVAQEFHLRYAESTFFVRKWVSFWLEECKRWGHHCSIPGF